MSTIANTKLINGQPTSVPDGTWYAIAVWSAKARDYVEDPSKGLHSENVDQLNLSLPTGSRLVRYTVSNGYVTTRRALA